MTTKATAAKRPTAAEKAARRARITRAVAGAAFLIGAGVSVAANMLAAEPTAVGRIVSAWPAVALLLTVELVQHVERNWPMRAAASVVAGIAAWLSYWHMVEVATLAGEGPVSAHLLPLTVDAMMAIAATVFTAKPQATATRRPAAKKAAAPRKLRAVS